MYIVHQCPIYVDENGEEEILDLLDLTQDSEDSQETDVLSFTPVSRQCYTFIIHTIILCRTM